MTIAIDRSICCDLNETITREWIVTNGLGGYAAGTVAGVLTRMQHGLLVAKLPHTAKPQLLLAKIDEEINFDQRTYKLGTNEYRDGTINPSGFVHLEAFYLEEGLPIFHYRIGGIDGIMLEKRIWMGLEENTTYIQYRVLPTTVQHKPSYGKGKIHTHQQQSISLTLLPFTTYRAFDEPAYGRNDYHFQVQAHQGTQGFTIQANHEAPPFHIMAVGPSNAQTTMLPTGVWYWNFLRREDARAGLNSTDDLYLPGVIRATLWPDEKATLTVIVSTEEVSTLAHNQQQIERAYKQSWQRQKQLSVDSTDDQRYFGEGGEAARELDYRPLLMQAVDRFIVHHIEPVSDNRLSSRRSRFQQSTRKTTLIANFYDMENRVRDTLIAIPGLMSIPEYHEEVYLLLKEIASYFIGGLLPERLPTLQYPLMDKDYYNADIALWYFYALDAYLQLTKDYRFLEEMLPQLKESIQRYIQGTHHGIALDHKDGLLYASKPQVALTWMNCYKHGMPVTQRAGKPVELNALWYLALSLLHEWTNVMAGMDYYSHGTEYYQLLQARCKQSFQERFWNEEQGCLYDVIDGPEGNDATLRVNQLFAIAFRYPLLDGKQRQQVFDVITHNLLTPVGLRTLAPGEPSYAGQRSYQGNVLPWLLGPYINAMLATANRGKSKSEQYPHHEYLWRKGMQLLIPYKEQFHKGLLGMCAGSFDGEYPHHALNSIGSLQSNTELLRVHTQLTQLRTENQLKVYSR